MVAVKLNFLKKIINLFSSMSFLIHAYGAWIAYRFFAKFGSSW